jgi:hypothetical protein
MPLYSAIGITAGSRKARGNSGQHSVCGQNTHPHRFMFFCRVAQRRFFPLKPQAPAATEISLYGSNEQYCHSHVGRVKLPYYDA